MNKEKIVSLTKYVNDLKARLEEKSLPIKHKNRQETYKQFLRNEIASTSTKLDKLKVS